MVLRALLTSERGSSNLEGGLRAVLMTFEHSGHPCAQVLSVPGLLVILAQIP